MTPLVLASTSSSRKVLLERLQLPFVQIAPEFSEIPTKGEAPSDMALRYALGKAQSVRRHLDGHGLIIGSDQVALLHDEGQQQQILDKPLTHAKAVRQLSRCSGRTVLFHTAVCLLNSSTDGVQSGVADYQVHFRRLSRSEIDSYLHKDTPYDCAGSFRAEGLGIALFTEMAGQDPTSLIGLPLITLVDMLKKEGVKLLK